MLCSAVGKQYRVQWDGLAHQPQNAITFGLDSQAIRQLSTGQTLKQAGFLPFVAFFGKAFQVSDQKGISCIHSASHHVTHDRLKWPCPNRAVGIRFTAGIRVTLSTIVLEWSCGATLGRGSGLICDRFVLEWYLTPWAPINITPVGGLIAD
jgi:hypothetical protein